MSVLVLTHLMQNDAQSIFEMQVSVFKIEISHLYLKQRYFYLRLIVPLVSFGTPWPNK